MWFDSHCHLHLCEAPLDEITSRAGAASVEAMLTAGTDVASSRRSVALADGQRVFAAVGVHPNSASEWSRAIEAEIRSLLGEPGVVAVGESGLDFYRDEAPPASQQAAFAAHIAMAKEHDKALIVHTRDSLDAAIEQLGEAGAPARFVFHCWSGGAAQLARALALGAYISFAGNVSFKSAGALRESAAAVPLDRLLVETDSPYLSPEPHRGRPNEPNHVPFVGAAVADARRSAPKDIAVATTANARALFGLAG